MPSAPVCHHSICCDASLILIHPTRTVLFVPSLQQKKNRSQVRWARFYNVFSLAVCVLERNHTCKGCTVYSIVFLINAAPTMTFSLILLSRLTFLLVYVTLSFSPSYPYIPSQLLYPCTLFFDLDVFPHIIKPILTPITPLTLHLIIPTLPLSLHPLILPPLILPPISSLPLYPPLLPHLYRGSNSTSGESSGLEVQAHALEALKSVLVGKIEEVRVIVEEWCSLGACLYISC